MTQSAYAKARSPKPHEQPATTGWTAPTLIYEKMRQINVSASALNSDVTANVRRDAFKSAWSAWFASWSAFFQKYQGTGAKLSALTFTDELFQQVLSFESQLVTWYDAYGREKDGDKTVAPASGAPPVPNVPIPPSKELPDAPDTSGLVIPWWAWVIGVGALAGAGYMTYVYVKRAQAVRRMLDEKVVPGVLQMYGGPAGPQLASGYGQYIAAARDPQGTILLSSTPSPSPMGGTLSQAVSGDVIPLPYGRYPGY